MIDARESIALVLLFLAGVLVGWRCCLAWSRIKPCDRRVKWWQKRI